MARMTFSPIVSVLAVVALVCGLGLLLMMAAWGRPLADGAEAARAGNLELALERYAAVENRFDRVPPAKQILPGAYRASLANQLQLQYLLRDYDTVIEKATLSPSTAPVHFWAGCALFEKARPEQKPEERVTWLNRAEEEFRKALELEPGDWDTKYNYELTRVLLRELLQDGEGEQEKLLPKLIEQPAPRAPARRVG